MTELSTSMMYLARQLHAGIAYSLPAGKRQSIENTRYRLTVPRKSTREEKL